ncbi:cell division protein FtsZ [Azoarcus sp. KH32C]|uniref:cell division protein FtsZ n=1 Tax=Azoarcus sp. KH32C TaxID=748247 RepID=UPI0002385EAC|nr:cell division protein FtsZ [Azoarcus sp. KH32C]BAL23471.1 cell division protein [Azoarcus sp. KH32C]
MQVVADAWAPRIVVMGVGGAGCNFIDALLGQPGAEQLGCVAANTDASALARSRALTKLQLGTSGLGAGAMSSAGRASAKTSRQAIRQALKHAQFLILVTGLGGGTGTGASPVIAKVARKMGIPVIAIVTRPFSFESRERVARKGLRRLRRQTEAVLPLSLDDFAARCGPDAAMDQLFDIVDREVINLVRCFTSTVLEPNMVNRDLSVVLDWLTDAGELSATSITGKGESALKEVLATLHAEGGIVARQLNDTRRVLVTITESSVPTMRSIRKIVRTVQEHTPPEAFFIYASTSEPGLDTDLRVTFVTSRMKWRRH